MSRLREAGDCDHGCYVKPQLTDQSRAGPHRPKGEVDLDDYCLRHPGKFRLGSVRRLGHSLATAPKAVGQRPLAAVKDEPSYVAPESSE